MAAIEYDRKVGILKSHQLDLKMALSELLDQVVEKMRVDAARIYLCDLKH